MDRLSESLLLAGVLSGNPNLYLLCDPNSPEQSLHNLAEKVSLRVQFPNSLNALGNKLGRLDNWTYHWPNGRFSFVVAWLMRSQTAARCQPAAVRT